MTPARGESGTGDLSQNRLRHLVRNVFHGIHATQKPGRNRLYRADRIPRVHKSRFGKLRIAIAPTDIKYTTV
jgi:hypothetical protein